VRLLPVRPDHGDGGLSQDHPNPTDDDIDANLTNICRCGTYERSPPRGAPRWQR